jgi:hypothetical protein
MKCDKGQPPIIQWPRPKELAEKTWELLKRKSSTPPRRWLRTFQTATRTQTLSETSKMMSPRRIWHQNAATGCPEAWTWVFTWRTSQGIQEASWQHLQQGNQHEGVNVVGTDSTLSSRAFVRCLMMPNISAPIGVAMRKSSIETTPTGPPKPNRNTSGDRATRSWPVQDTLC